MSPTDSDFSHLTVLQNEILPILKSYGVPKNYRRGTLLMAEGDIATAMYIVETGQIKIYVSDKVGREVILDVQGPGAVVGEMALLEAKTPRSASVITLETTEVIQITAEAFEQCLADHAKLALSLVRQLAQRVRALSSRVRVLSLFEVPERILRILSSQARLAEDGRGYIDTRLTQQDIANMVGASREMVSRALREFQRNGQLALSERRLFIISAECMQAFREFHP